MIEKKCIYVVKFLIEIFIFLTYLNNWYIVYKNFNENMGPKRIRNTRNVVTANIVNSPNMPNLSPNNTMWDTSPSRTLPNNLII